MIAVFSFHKAFIKAWTQACASPTPTKILIPAGTYKLTGIDVRGPCKAPIGVQVDGTIQAPSDINLVQKGSDQWVRFQYINSLTLSGKGVFDGQGAAVWKKGGAAWSKGSSTSTKISMVNILIYFIINSKTNNCTFT